MDILSESLREWEDGDLLTQDAIHELAKTRPLIYTPLDESRQEIRLLEIYPQAGTISVHYRLVTLSLLDKPSYVALSYTWGDAKPVGVIRVNDELVAITNNLRLALLDFARPIAKAYQKTVIGILLGLVPSYEPLRIWVDAVCINQHDIEERNRQVRLMAKIYQQAEQVQCWLGDCDPIVKESIHLMANMDQHLHDSLVCGKSLEWMREFPQLWADDGTGTGQFWEGVMELTTYEYWKRIWVVQEMVFASKLVVMVGGLMFYWDVLLHILVFCQQVRRGSLARPDFFPPSSWSIIASSHMNEWETIRMVQQLRQDRLDNESSGRAPGGRNWLFLLTSTRSHRATDPRDKVFALLNLIDIDMNADYSLSLKDVYTQLACLCLTTGRASEAFTWAGTGWPADREVALPSWVPDWQSFSKAPLGTAPFFEHVSPTAVYTGGPVARRLYAANCGLALPKLQICSGRVVRVFGYVFDKVESVEPLTHDLDEFAQLVARCASRMSKTAELTLPLRVLFSTFLMNMDPRGRAESLYSNLLRTEEIFVHLLTLLQPTHEEVHHPLAMATLGLGQTGDLDAEFEQIFFSEIPAEEKASLRGFTAHYNDLVEKGRDEGTVIQIEKAVLANTGRKRVFWMSDGSIGLGPINMQVDDIVCVLECACFPVVLRKVSAEFELVGCCFVYGIMNGEIVNIARQRSMEAAVFDIC